MTNRILRVEIRDHALSPAEADVRVRVVPERLDASTEVRGRLLGPRCLFAETIEVAYPLRRLGTAPDGIDLRAIIPEPSLWDPASPHLYVAVVELWQGGVRREEVRLRHGVRQLRIGPGGLRLNGGPITLRGGAVESLTDADAHALRQAGYNLLIAPATAAGVWEVADRVGFLVLGEPGGDDPPDGAPDGLAEHPSSLGWLGRGVYSLTPTGGASVLRGAGCPDPLGVVEP